MYAVCSIKAPQAGCTSEYYVISIWPRVLWYILVRGHVGLFILKTIQPKIFVNFQNKVLIRMF